MWPEKGSGFEASPYSPAGRAQQDWLLSGRALRGDRRALLLLLVFPGGIFAVAGVVMIVQLIASLFD